MTNTTPNAIIPPINPSNHANSGSSMGHSSFTPYQQPPILNNQTPIVNNVTVETNPQDMVLKLTEIKHNEYTKKAKLFRNLHYFLLVAGAILSVATPFLIPINPVVAQITSIMVVISLSVDHIFKPKEKWTVYSKATDLIQLQLFKSSGAYTKNKKIIDTILETEARILETVPDLNDVLAQVKSNIKTTK